MKKRTKEAVESLLLALPGVLQANDALSEEERASGWRIFDKLLRTYIKKQTNQGGRND